MLTNQQISLAKTNWKSRKPLGLSMTFVESIRPNPLQNENPNPKKNPDQAEKIAHERLAEESGDTSLQPSDAVDPAENDFVFATFRALSATVLADRPIDFTDEKMLKAAVSKLNGQTVFKDHNTSVNNWVGRVESSHWDHTTAGFPSGINAILKLDTVKDPMTVRGVLQGAIHSASVTVSFEWKPSHPALMETGTFFDHLGEEIEGELKRLAKEIDNLVNFISSGVATDLDSVAGALREKEVRKSDLEYEFDSLGSEDSDKVPLITPFAVKEKLAYMVEKICEKSDRFNGSLSALFDEPLQLSKADGVFVLEGRVNVGAALSFQGVRQYRMASGSNVHLANPESLDGNQGSRQCTNASPTGIEPVLPP